MWFFFFLFYAYSSHSEVDHDLGSWNSVTVIKKIDPKQDISLEHELRYSDDVGNLAQQQFKLLYRYEFKYGRLGLGGNLRFKNTYGPINEKRLLVEWESLIFQASMFSYSTRVRYELRNFADEPSFARRLRWLNEVEFNFKFLNGWVPILSSEFNYYINDTSVNKSGFYSHRTVVSVGKFFGPYGLAFQYINDYKDELFNDIIDNAFGSRLTYKF